MFRDRNIGICRICWERDALKLIASQGPPISCYMQLPCVVELMVGMKLESMKSLERDVVTCHRRKAAASSGNSFTGLYR
jgi:hypothetical protein